MENIFIADEKGASIVNPEKNSMSDGFCVS
jgi:hypothetical protein